MKIILFYEKPGCSTNAKQKKSLKDTGCMVITRNLLKFEMHKDELLTYLKHRSLQEWFNPNAPKIKSGEIDPKDFSLEEALELLLHDPILIRRPLVSINGHRMCGFDPKAIEDALGFSLK
ncbi:MAG: arsenate reductase family protein, partial [Sulfurovum sp.]|nr:arsenate reductase family protein [Sulfurovum sp.]